MFKVQTQNQCIIYDALFFDVIYMMHCLCLWSCGFLQHPHALFPLFALWSSLIWRLDLLIYRRNFILWSLLMMRSTIKDLRTWLESYILWEFTDLVLSSQTSLDHTHIPEISWEKEWAICWSDIGVRWGSVAHWMWMVGVPHTTVYNIYVRGPF